jgi:hypothetical protein
MTENHSKYRFMMHLTLQMIFLCEQNGDENYHYKNRIDNIIFMVSLRIFYQINYFNLNLFYSYLLYKATLFQVYKVFTRKY